MLFVQNAKDASVDDGKLILKGIGPQGIDAATRIVGFFVSTMGMALIFHGIIEVMQQYGAIPKP